MNNIFTKQDVYEQSYTYEEMKVMHVLAQCNTAEGLDYEDLICIAQAIYVHWANSGIGIEDVKYEKYPWMAIQTMNEEGYVQVYAIRTALNFIKLYKEVIKNDTKNI